MLVGTGVLVGIAEVVGITVPVPGVRVVFVEGGVGVRLDVAVLIGVLLAGSVYELTDVDCPCNAVAVRFMGFNEVVPVVVTVTVPEVVAGSVAVREAVEDGTGVVVEEAIGVGVGVKKRMANASRVMARSKGVGVGVNLGVRTISGRVSNLSPPNTMGR